MAEQPIIAASLLSGRMPDNIEETFSEVGLSMFPDRKDDLETDCSCPDWSNPCKHIAAVYLLLGEEFDRDPFLIFRMRGMDREDLLGPEFRRSAQTLEPPALPPEPLPPEVEEFWSNPLTALHDRDLAGPAIVPNADAALPQQLGRFPLWQGNREFVPAMQAIYHAASQRAVELVMTEAVPGNPAPGPGNADADQQDRRLGTCQVTSPSSDTSGGTTVSVSLAVSGPSVSINFRSCVSVWVQPLMMTLAVKVSRCSCSSSSSSRGVAVTWAESQFHPAGMVTSPTPEGLEVVVGLSQGPRYANPHVLGLRLGQFQLQQRLLLASLLVDAALVE